MSVTGADSAPAVERTQHAVGEASPAVETPGAVMPLGGGPTPLSPGWNWARSRDVVITIIGGAVVVVMAAWILQHFTKVILILVMAAIVAFMIGPIVEVLEQAGVRRGTATFSVYAVFLLVLIGVGSWVGSGLVTQLSQLSQQVPVYTQDVQQSVVPAVRSWLEGHGIQVDVTGLEQEALSGLKSASTALLGRGIEIATGVTDAVVNVILVLVISLYLVLDGQRMLRDVQEFVPANRRGALRFFEQSLTRVLGGYIRGQLTMALIIGVSAGIGCQLLGVKYSVVIGVLAFFFELIPMLGPVLGAVPAILISLFQQPFPLLTLLVVAFFVVMQLIESNVLGPRITGHAVGLHPVVSILALLGGADLAGLWGALFAVPVVGLAVVIGSAIADELRGVEPAPVPRAPRPFRPRLRRRKAASDAVGDGTAQ